MLHGQHTQDGKFFISLEDMKRVARREKLHIRRIAPRTKAVWDHTDTGKVLLYFLDTMGVATL